jgi:proline iminopeptidase
LSDPRQYTVDRQVADLEAIRKKIGAKKLILIGDSWGATLAASYMAEHPERCAKAILTSPGAIDGTEWKEPTVYQDAATVREVERWTREFVQQYPRVNRLLVDDPQAAYRAAPESELDAHFDELLNRLLPTLCCNVKIPNGHHAHGMGWWVNTMISRDLTTRTKHPARALRNNKTPVLIMRGGCDYVRWEVARQYRSVLSNSTLVHVPRAGHWIAHDQPAIYSSTIRSFLAGKPLSVTPYTADVAPERDDRKAE